jgi:hypothetical protein
MISARSPTSHADDVEPNRGRVEHRDALAHPLPVDSVAHETGCLRQLDSVVDAEDLAGFGHHAGRHRPTVAAQQADHVREVLLTLGVVGGQAGQTGGKAVAGERVHPRVDLGDSSLLVIAVLVLDDRRHPAVRISHDAAVTERIVEAGGENGGRGIGVAVFEQQRRQGRTREQRGVTRQHDDGSTVESGAAGGELGQGDPDGMAGAVLLLLDDGQDPRGDLGDMRRDLLTTMAYDHDQMLGLDGRRCLDDVPEQGATRDLMQDLGRR